MNFADKLTTLRFLLIPFFVSLLFYFNADHLYIRYFLVAVFGLAALTDFFDGLVARIKNEKSALGQIIDPLADKLLLLTAFIALYALRQSLPIAHKIPLWVVLIIVSRDGIILIGVFTFYLLKTEVPIAPSWWGKVTTSLQMATILSVILDIGISAYIWTLAVVFTVISGIKYFLRGVRALNENHFSTHT